MTIESLQGALNDASKRIEGLTKTWESFSEMTFGGADLTIQKFLSKEAQDSLKQMYLDSSSEEGLAKKIKAVMPNLRASAQAFQDLTNVSELKMRFLKHELASNPNAGFNAAERSKELRSHILRGANKSRNSSFSSVSSIVGGSDALERRIKRGVGDVNSIYDRNMAFDLEPICAAEMAVCEERLREKINGRELSKKREKELRRSSSKASRVMQNLGQFAAVGAWNSFGKYIGRGITHKGLVADDSNCIEYQKSRDALIAQYSSQGLGIDRHGLEGVASLNSLKHVFRSQCHAMGIGDGALMEAFDKKIDNQIEALKGENSKKLEAFNQEIDELNKTAMKNAEELSKEGDSMAKFRILQIFLIASPFGLFSFLGPIADVLGPLLECDTFAEAMSEIVTSDVFWVFGDLADLIEMDRVVQFVFEIPGIEDLGNFMQDILTSEIADNLFGAAGGSFISGALPALVVATAFSFRRAQTEMNHLDKRKKYGEKDKEELKEAFENFARGKDEDKSSEKIVRSCLADVAIATAEAKSVGELIDFIERDATINDGKSLVIFDDIKLECDVDSGDKEKLNLTGLANKGVNLRSYSNISDYVQGLDGLSRQKMLQKMLVFKSIGQDNKGDTAADILTKFQEIPPVELDSKSKELAKLDNAMKIVSLAKDSGIETFLPNVDDHLRKYEDGDCLEADFADTPIGSQLDAIKNNFMDRLINKGLEQCKSTSGIVPPDNVVQQPSAELVKANKEKGPHFSTSTGMGK